MVQISIITVCKNAESLLGKTIFSVLAQSRNNYEYMIQDGGSDDKTLHIAKSFEKNFKEHNIRYAIYSEKDYGIYDAMNKAIKKSEGDWLIFLNAGDTFYDTRVLEYFENITNKAGADLVYGHTNYVFSENRELIVVRKHSGVYKGMGICQQSIFYRKRVLEERKFNTSYKLLADYEYLLYMLDQNYKFLYINLVISNYDYNGLSSISCEQVYKERAKIMESYGIICKKKRSHMYLKIKEKIIARFPVLNMLQAICTELNKGE